MTAQPEAIDPLAEAARRKAAGAGLTIAAAADMATARLLTTARRRGLADIDVRAIEIIGANCSPGIGDARLAAIARAVISAVGQAYESIPWGGNR
jgi:hypothetical protein